MNVMCRARCHTCKAPLRVSFVTYGSTREWLYTWILKENINLGYNAVLYKKFGSKIHRVCFSCYFQTEEKSLSETDIFDWLQRGHKYTLTVEKDHIPMIFIWTYWLIVPGLYAWYHRSKPPRTEISYADLDM